MVILSDLQGITEMRRGGIEDQEFDNFWQCHLFMILMQNCFHVLPQEGFQTFNFEGKHGYGTFTFTTPTWKKHK